MGARLEPRAASKRDQAVDLGPNRRMALAQKHRGFRL
jgi:hypothetical protein